MSLTQCVTTPSECGSEVKAYLLCDKLQHDHAQGVDVDTPVVLELEDLRSLPPPPAMDKFSDPTCQVWCVVCCVGCGMQMQRCLSYHELHGANHSSQVALIGACTETKVAHLDVATTTVCGAHRSIGVESALRQQRRAAESGSINGLCFCS